MWEKTKTKNIHSIHDESYPVCWTLPIGEYLSFWSHWLYCAWDHHYGKKKAGGGLVDATGSLELVVEHGLPVTLWIGYNVLDSPMRDE